MKKKGLVFSAFVLGALLLMGCASATAGSGGGEATGSEQAAEQDLGMVCALIGKDDADTADLLGGGEENWTEDGVTFIGRIYDTELYGEPVTVYTTCSPEKKVDSVSIWITDGSQAVTEEQLAEWQRYVTDATGAEMQQMPVSAESGTQSWEWQTEDHFYTLRLLENILTLGINPAVGELQ